MLRIGLGLLLVALAYPLGILLFADQWVFGGAMVTGTFTVGATLVVGVPSVAWCLRRKWLSPWAALLAGSFAGLLCSLVFWFGQVGQVLQLSLPFVAVGATHGLIFWVVAFWRNSRIRNVASPTKAAA